MIRCTMAIRDYIKTILRGIAYIIVIPLLIFKPLLIFVKYLIRSVYTEYKRKDFAKSYSTMTISIPITLTGGKYIICGKDVFLGANGILSAWGSYGKQKFSPRIFIGNNVTISNGFHISAANKIIIKDWVLIGKYVTIVDNSHGEISKQSVDIPPILRSLRLKGEGIVIEENVWIGDKVTIIGSVNIGKGAIIGANSVVTKDIPSYSIAVGSPAKIIRTIV